MKDEIKEIIDKMNDLSYYEVKDTTGTKWIELKLDEADKLVHYITNLQEENKEWSMIFDTFSKRPYAHKYLEQKKKELNNPNLIGLDSEMIYKDYYDLKERKDKALEFLDNEYNYKKGDAKFNRSDYVIWQSLKNILGGDE